MAHLSKMALSFCLSIETSPGWMEALIKAVKQHEVLIGDHGHDLVYDLRDEAAASLEKGENWFLVTRIEGENPDSPIYSLSSGAKGQEVDMLGIGWKEILEALAPYGITGERGWCPVPAERRDWLSRTQQQEDAMAEQTATVMKRHLGSLPKGAHQVRVILPGGGRAWGKKRRK